MFTNRKQLHQNHLVQSQSVFATVLHHQHLLLPSSRSTQPSKSQLYFKIDDQSFPPLLSATRYSSYHFTAILYICRQAVPLSQPRASCISDRRPVISTFAVCHTLQQLPLHSHLIHLPSSSSTQPNQSQLYFRWTTSHFHLCRLPHVTAATTSQPSYTSAIKQFHSAKPEPVVFQIDDFHLFFVICACKVILWAPIKCETK